MQTPGTRDCFVGVEARARTAGLTSVPSEVYPGILYIHLEGCSDVLVTHFRIFHLIFPTTLSGKGTVFQYSHQTEGHTAGHRESLALTDTLDRS